MTSALIKYGIFTCAFVMSTDYLWNWYQKLTNRSPRINEVVFTKSNVCCSHAAPIEQVENCRNPHCGSRLARKIIDHIKSAKHIICLCMYMFTMRHLCDAILEARQRGVKIRIITDHSMIASSGSRINFLQGAGVPVRIAGNGEMYMHNKFCLIDVLTDEPDWKELNTDPQQGVLINGSLNWTTNAFDRNWENVIFTSDVHLKSEFKKAFDQIWASCE